MNENNTQQNEQNEKTIIIGETDTQTLRQMADKPAGKKRMIHRKKTLDSINRLDERRGIIHIRRHLAASPIFKNIPDFRRTRIEMLRANTLDELFTILDSVPSKIEKN